MGGKSSKETKPSIRTNLDAGCPQPSSVTSTPKHLHASAPSGCDPQPPKRRLDRKYSRIGDGYKSLEKVTCDLSYMFIFLILYLTLFYEKYSHKYSSKVSVNLLIKWTNQKHVG